MIEYVLDIAGLAAAFLSAYWYKSNYPRPKWQYGVLVIVAVLSLVL